MKRPKKFVEYYARLSRADLTRLAWWDRDENQGRVFRPWRPFRHPQLGDVELGGIDPRVGVWNPPYEELGKVCEDQSAAYLRVASLAPRLQIGHVERTPLGGDLTRVELRVENVGYLPTYVLASARKLDWNEPVHVDCAARRLRAGRSRRRAQDPRSPRRLGPRPAQPAPTSRRTCARRATATPPARSTSSAAPARCSVRIGSCRTGWINDTISV